MEKLTADVIQVHVCAWDQFSSERMQMEENAGVLAVRMMRSGGCAE